MLNAAAWEADGSAIILLHLRSASNFDLFAIVLFSLRRVRQELWDGCYRINGLFDATH